jgi:hypothetical protein
MIRRDILWKGIIEDLAEDFLHFFFSKYIDRIYSERRGLGVRHKPDARVYADTKSFLVPNYFVVGIDFSRGLEFLDKDLERIMPEADTKRRHADKLFKAWLKDGREQWFLVHVNSARRGLGFMHKPDARVYADTE